MIMKKISMKSSSTSATATATQTLTSQIATRALIVQLRPNPKSSSRSHQGAAFTPSRAKKPFPPITAVAKVAAARWRKRLAAWSNSRRSWYRPLSIGIECSSASKTLGASRRPPQPLSMGLHKQKWEEESASSSRSTISQHQSLPCRANLCSRTASAKCRRSICQPPSGPCKRSPATTRVTVKMSCVSITILMAQTLALEEETLAAATSVPPKSTDLASWVTISRTLSEEISRL